MEWFFGDSVLKGDEDRSGDPSFVFDAPRIEFGSFSAAYLCREFFEAKGGEEKW